METKDWNPVPTLHRTAPNPLTSPAGRSVFHADITGWLVFHANVPGSSDPPHAWMDRRLTGWGKVGILHLIV